MIGLYLSLGSNLGDRSANIHEALNRLDRSFGVKYERLSDIIETESWGFDSEPFLNCAVLYKLPRTKQSAEDQAVDILDRIKVIEREMGREESLEYSVDGRRIYHSRPIDIDILFFGPHRIDLPALKIPHPLIAERDFVKIPLAQIANTSLKNAFPALKLLLLHYTKNQKI